MMDALRAVPEIVIALVLIYVMGGGPVPAVIAIALHSSGALGKLFSEAAENADLKPVEGLNSVGASWLQSIWLGVIPQVAPNWLSYALLRFEINIRASAILGFVGSGGIGYSLKLAMQWGQGKYDQVAAIFILLFAAIVLFDQLSSHGAQPSRERRKTMSPLHSLYRKKRMIAFGAPALLLAYFTYIFFAFDIPGIAARANTENAAILLSDFWSHKTHVTRDNRTGETTVSLEGEKKGTYTADQWPDWVVASGDTTTIDLGDGHIVTYDADGAHYTVPGYGVIDMHQGNGIEINAPQPMPPEIADWINASKTRVSITNDHGRIAYTKSKVETFYYEAGMGALVVRPRQPVPWPTACFNLVGLSFFAAPRPRPRQYRWHGAGLVGQQSLAARRCDLGDFRNHPDGFPWHRRPPLCSRCPSPSWPLRTSRRSAWCALACAACSTSCAALTA